MATTAFGAGDFNAALEKVIQPYIQDNIPNQTKLLKVLKKNNNVRFFNDNFYAPIRSNRHSGVVNLASDKAKLRTGNASVIQASVSPKYLSATFDISDVIKKATAGDRGAVESAMTFQMEAMKNDFAKAVNRQYHSDGVGVIAQVSGSVGAGTLSVMYPNASVDDGRVTPYYGTATGDIKATKYFTVGQAIGIGTGAADVGTITAITGDAAGALGTLVVTGGPAIVANDSVYLVDGDETGAGTSEIQGIRKALSEGTADYAGLARSSSEVWQPQFMGTAAAASLSIIDMETLYMSAVEYAQEGDRYAWFMNKSLYTKYGDLLTALRRTVNKTELVSGWSGLAFEAGQGNVGVFLDFDTPDGDAVLLNLDTWTVCEIAPMGFVEDNTLRRSDYITFQKVFSWYTNLLCVAPAANGRLVRRTR